jgi:tetratricopeptide (TPR) repeat protein
MMKRAGPNNGGWPFHLPNEKPRMEEGPCSYSGRNISHSVAKSSCFSFSIDFSLDYLTGALGLRDRYTRTGALDDLEKSIVVCQQAVETAPSSSSDWPIYLTNLANGLSDRYERTGVLDDLEQAIAAHQQAVEATPSGSPGRPMYLTNLSIGLHERYARTGVLDDLERAIATQQQVVEATPPNSPARPGRLSNLANRLRDRYARTGVLDDLERAIATQQQVVEATSPDSPNYPAFLINLGLGLRDRYARTGVLDDLEQAIAVYQQALNATQPNSSVYPTLLSHLGRELLARYARTGALNDLERAITICQQAVEATSPNSPERPGRLINLANGLGERYARTGVLDDLEKSIANYQQAVEATPPDSPDRPRRLSNLGASLLRRYTRTKALPDLEESITTFQQAVEATPPGSPERSMYLSNLGNGLLNRYENTRALDDLERAITAHQQALSATPPNSPHHSGFLTNLSNGFLDRYRQTGALDDLERAIAIYQQVVVNTPPNSPNHSMDLSNLALGLNDRYLRTGSLADLEKIITDGEENWSSLQLRFVALPIDYQLGQQRQGVQIADSLIRAHLERSVRFRPDSRIGRCRALEVAEGSKSRLLTQLVGRGPLPLPPGLSSEVAAREQHLLSDLTTLDTLELISHDQPTPVQQEGGSLNRLQQRQADLIELERLWGSIARLGTDGAEYVALRRGTTPTLQDLADLARELGRATALLSLFITSDHVLLFLLRAGWRGPHVSKVPLNKVGWDNLLERFFREVHLYSPGLQRGETWYQSLRPLLIEAQRYLTGVERLILAPAGNGHVLPWSVLMERVGWRNPVDQPLPLVTLPALSVLPRLRRRSKVPIDMALVIGNPTDNLPMAEDEAREVAAFFGTTPLLRSAATKETVLSRLEEASLIHMATHAFFDSNNPLESGIVLADGVLTVREVLQYRLKADLLVLSACESGQVGSLGGEELAGLSQAFLQAGVRSLLVSLWQVDDPATAALVRAFYTAWQAGADKALALRQAMTQAQQDSRWSHPYYWGAFVLVGDWD